MLKVHQGLTPAPAKNFFVPRLPTSQTPWSLKNNRKHVTRFYIYYIIMQNVPRLHHLDSYSTHCIHIHVYIYIYTNMYTTANIYLHNALIIQWINGFCKIREKGTSNLHNLASPTIYPHPTTTKSKEVFYVKVAIRFKPPAMAILKLYYSQTKPARISATSKISNMSPKKGPLYKWKFHLPTINFQGIC